MKNTNPNEAGVEQAVPQKPKKSFSFSEKIIKRLTLTFFAVVWLLLAFLESAQLFRVHDLSLFLFTEQFFKEMMVAPAGLLSYIGCFLIQFFYYPALGAAIYVALLFAVYYLVRKVFAISARWSLTALLPVVFLLASNMFMGYWIYYNKLQGLFYIAVVGTIFVLLAMWACKKLPMWAKFIFVALWSVVGYPFFGIYALVGAFLMALQALCGKGNIAARVALLLLSLALAGALPALAYGNLYTSTSQPLMYAAGIPAYQFSLATEAWYIKRVWMLWMPFVLLFVTMVLFAIFSDRVEGKKVTDRYTMCQAALCAIIVLATWGFWYSDSNFTTELKQHRAMWDEDWERVAELGKTSCVPTRLIVMNRNIALLHLGRAGEEMFHYPDGSAIPESTMNVRLVQTGGKMAYYQYGRFNFCYRWCVEDAVEYGWKVEYLKHAVRSMIASGQYKTARRYVEILKHTLFHASWAEKYEKMIYNIKLADKAPEISFPRLMFKYRDTLDVDESHVEAYLLNQMTSNLFVKPTPVCAEASLMHALIRKDTQLFWNAIVEYLNTHKQLRIPTHYQEALLLYANIDRRADISKFKFDKKIEQRFRDFSKLTSKYRGMTEEQMAPYFKDDFGDTYWYFYFFIRDIKSN